MEGTPKKTFVKSDGTRKVVVFQREDKTFGFEEFKFGPEENSWFPVAKYSLVMIDSLEKAISEARGRIQRLAPSDS